METFFITYNTGEYDSYREHVYVINAESKEALYEEISKAIDIFENNNYIYRTERNRIDELYRPKNVKTLGEKVIKEYHQKLDEFFEKYSPQYNYIVFGFYITPFDKTTVGTKDQAFYSANLKIYTVEEYIESCRPEKAN